MSAASGGGRAEGAREDAHDRERECERERERLDRQRLCEDFEKLTMSDPMRAATEGETHLRRMLDAEDAACFAYISRSLVNALAHLGKAREAIRYAAAARRVARVRAPIEAARIMMASMHPRAKLGDLKGAMRAGEQAAREFTALDEPALVARAELNLANVAKALGQPTRAITLITRVLSQGEAIAAIRGQALNVLGEAHVQAADLDAARRAFDAALAVFTAQGQEFACAVVAGNLADTAARAGDIEHALRGFRDARERFSALGAHAEACRNAIEEAMLLEFAGFSGEARDLARDALAAADAHGLAAESARARLVIGSSLLAAADPFTAKAELLNAAQRFAAIGDSASVAQSMTLLARCARTSDRAQALECAERAVCAARVAAAPVELAGALAARALVATSNTDALHDASEAVAMASSLSNPALRAEAHASEAHVARRIGTITRSIEHARIALREVESAHRTLGLARTRRAYLTRRSDIASELAACLIADGSPAALREAFDALDRCRSLAILDAIERPSRDERAKRPGILDARARALIADLGPGAFNADTTAQAARFDRDANRAELERALAEHREEAAPEQRFVRVLAAPCVTLVEHDGHISLLARMPDGSTRARTLAASHVEVAAAETEFAFHVTRRLHGAQSQRAQRAAQRATDALRALVQPSLDALLVGWRGTVVLVHGGLFARIPAALLVDFDQNVCLAPSLEVASLLDQRADNTHNTHDTHATVVSVSDQFAPAIEREGDVVQQHLAQRMPTKRLTGERATRDAFMDALASASLMHVACHGTFPPDAPNLAGLKLADGWFTARDAHALERAPRELVLSGCTTAASARHDGEEWLGLVRGFAAAGTQCLIASLWPVEDESTASIMERLHAAGSSPCRALGTVVRELRETGAHPAVWGAFCVIGGAHTFRARMDDGNQTSTER